VTLAALVLLLAQDAATLTFAHREPASHPGTMIGTESVRVDLSALKGREVFRAVFRPGRDDADAFAGRLEPVTVTLEGSDQPLPLLPPRFRAFDATAAVKGALVAGKTEIAFRMVSFAGYRPPFNRLEVTCAAKAANPGQRVRDLAARHQAGRTFLTWKELDAPPEGELSIQRFRAWRNELRQRPVDVRYRVYRSAEPITAATIGRAELVDEIGPHSGFNEDYYGVGPDVSQPVLRYVVEEGKAPVEAGTAVYVHAVPMPGKAWYAVSVARGGQEDFAELASLADPVDERPGRGEPVLQRVEKPKSFQYVDAPTLHYFVRWESAPASNVPSRPFDYVVAVPPKAVEPAPVGLHLHCWGGSLNGGYGWWYNAGQGAILIATNQIPYDWWTGYHEAEGTWKSWKEGVVRDTTQERVMAFLDWAGTRWKLDPARVFTAGNSMGGSGAPNLAFRRGDRIAWSVSWVGVHTPAGSPQFRGSYERVYGSLAWKLPYQDGKTAAFDWFDDAAFARRDPGAETPLVCFSNGKNDGGIGWPQARHFWKALQETRRPHVFVWGQGGHGQRALLPGPSPGERELGIDVRLDRTLPAFTACSLDGDPGNGEPADGDREGQSNLHLVWEDASSVDEAGRWSMFLRLNARAPKSECTVDVTPRRCRNFRPKPGTAVEWRSVGSDSKELASGEVRVDAWGLATVPQAPVRRDGVRLTLTVK
jgi:hypothetical protein